MSWPLVFSQQPITAVHTHGICFFVPKDDENWAYYHTNLSPKYFAQHAKTRLPIIVILPRNIYWCVDQLGTKDGVPHGGGWNVTGKIGPIGCTLNCTPSINFNGLYHGFVQIGPNQRSIVTDDCEGRKFTADGVFLP